MQLDIWKKEHDHEITFSGQTSKNSEWKQKEEQNALKQKKKIEEKSIGILFWSLDEPKCFLENKIVRFLFPQLLILFAQEISQWQSSFSEKLLNFFSFKNMEEWEKFCFEWILSVL